MSLIGKLLGWIGWPQWVLELVAIALVCLCFLGWNWHERSVGAQKCETADARVAAAQKAGQELQAAKDQKRIEDAQDAFKTEHAALTALRTSLPVDHLVCYAPGPKPVPAAGKIRAPEVAGAGPLPQQGPRDTFDPGPALDQLHDEADDLLAACRRLNDSVPH